jgi:glutaredoxin 3
MITIYGNETCVYCRKAKALAESYGLKHEWRDTDDQSVLNDLKIRLPNVKTIPQIWWHDRHIGGHEDLLTEIGNTLGGFGEGSC